MRTFLAKLFLCLLIAWCHTSALATDRITVVNLKCDNRTNPLGIDIARPRLSWESRSELRNQMQLAYQIIVADNPVELASGNGNMWNSEKVLSDNSLHIEYDGKPLESGKKYFWKVRVWYQPGFATDWSETAFWLMGLLNPSDWQSAAWIGFETLPDSLKVIPGVHGSGDGLGRKALRRTTIPLFRKEFDVPKSISHAELYICGLGQYEASMNGRKIDESFLSPGWTYFEKTCLYNVYDVTRDIHPGRNAIGVIVGNGFYNINRERYRKLVVAFDMPKMICMLAITHTDGTTQTTVSGRDWKCTASPITYTSIYGGEDYDARLEIDNWDSAGFDESHWNHALLVPPPGGKLVAQSDYPLAVMDVFTPKKTRQIDSARILYDFGQNASGIVELTVSGKRGQVVKLVPGELIHPDGTINQQASGEPYVLTYTLRGRGSETWRPRFTYYGARYVLVDGATSDSVDTSSQLPHMNSLKFLHTRNSSPRAGTFSCSNPLFDKIYSLIDWAIKSNIQSVVTDCPHREKLGWLEQTHLMGASMHYNYQLHQLYTKAVRDMIDAQTPSGLVPDIAPEYVEFEGGFRDSPEWGSASVILPWMLYRWYGDKQVMQRAWPMMKKYVAYLGTKAEGHILSHGLGDWYDLGPKFPGQAQLTPIEVTATASYYADITLLANMATILGHDADARHLSILAAEVRNAFNKRFFNPLTGIYSTGSQTAMAMPLCVGLVEPQYRPEVMKNLVRTIADSGWALSAGDVGFHYLIQALEEGGASQVIYNMNSRIDVPGYGFQLQKGATALTESWPALEQVSNNHLMLGHIMEWFYAGLAGIKQDSTSVAFKKIIIQPSPVGDITSASATYDSPYGLISSSWTKSASGFELAVQVPVNTSATVVLPTSNASSITERGQPLDGQFGLRAFGDNQIALSIHSGSYLFRSR